MRGGLIEGATSGWSRTHCSVKSTVNRMAFLGYLNMIRTNLDKSDEEWLKIKESIDRYNLGGLKMLTFD